MAFLRKLATLLTLSFLFSCADGEVTVTQIDYLETDTHINSIDLSNHSQATELALKKDNFDESRALIKLPTQEEKEVLDDILKSPGAFFFFPWVITLAVLQAILDCRNSVITASNLTSATLVFDIVSSDEADLTNKVALNLVSKPWWQTASWKAAHPFSKEGKWTDEGGDTDPDLATILSTQNGETLEFLMTDYFRTLISNGSTRHYGMILSASGDSLGTTKLKSAQNATRPRVVSVYTGSCGSSAVQSETKIYELPQNSLLSIPAR